MCEKNQTKKQKFRTMLRGMEPQEAIQIAYDPNEMTLSTMRVTASTLGKDLGRRYTVNIRGEFVDIARML